mmetsp:Transcript_8000/g.19757  ORF Transcript_8000/g.19757 Transcript_8000/m.19757 type:complete len:121 (-) Transcript_8000:1108-1470(-)
MFFIQALIGYTVYTQWGLAAIAGKKKPSSRHHFIGALCDLFARHPQDSFVAPGGEEGGLGAPLDAGGDIPMPVVRVQRQIRHNVTVILHTPNADALIFRVISRDVASTVTCVMKPPREIL